MKTMFNKKNDSGRWYRGNLHAHTTASDGRMDPEAVMAWYRDAGYDFLALTDHRMVTRVPSLPDLLVIPATEVNTAKDRVDDPHLNGEFHIVGVGTTGELEYQESKDPQDVINMVLAADGIAIIAHPAWGANMIDAEFLNLSGYIGLECYNTYCDRGKHKGLGSPHWDMLLGMGQCAFGFASDDSHGKIANDKGGGWIMVCAEELTQQAVLAGIRSGQFYASSGPDIHRFEIHDGTVTVECSPAKAVHFIGKGRNGLSVYPESEGTCLTSATYTLNGREGYMRVEVVDDQFRTAWSNPVFLDGKMVVSEA